jgi:hypothetical protein
MFFISKASRLALMPTHHLIHWVAGTLSPGVKWPGQVVDDTPLCSIEVKNM